MPDRDSLSFPVQRRNLLWISSLVLFVELGKVTPAEEVHLPFFNAEILCTEVIVVFMHALLLYFGWRYFVVFVNRGLVPIQSPVMETVRSWMKVQARKMALQEIQRLELQIQPNTGVDLRRDPLALGNKSNDETVQGGGYCYRCHTVQGVVDLDVMEVKGNVVKFIKLKAYIKHCLIREYFIEYFLPFVVFGLALLQTFDIGIAAYISRFLIW